MRQIFLMLSLMLIVMLAMHFKQIVRANAADCASMVQSQTMFVDQSQTPQIGDMSDPRDAPDPRDATAAAETVDVGN